MIFDEFARIAARALREHAGGSSVRITAIRPSRHGPVVAWEAPGLAQERHRHPIEGGGWHLGPPAGPLLLAVLARTLAARWRAGAPRCPRNWDRHIAQQYVHVFGGHPPPVGPGWMWLLIAGAQSIRARGVPTGFWTTDLKEKYGRLIWDFSANEDCEDVQEILDAIEHLSGFVCEDCGAPGRIRTGGWMKCRCDAHHERRRG